MQPATQHPTPDQRYNAYAVWASNLGITPAEFESWEKEVARIAELKIVDLERRWN